MTELDNTSKKPERDEKGRLLPGQESLNPKGKPKGTLSFTTEIKKFLMENPEDFKEICRYYIKDKRMRDLLWKMIDGQPKQAIEHGLDDTIEEVNINIRKNE